MNKLIMITGSTSGIGLAAAKSLAKKGFDIIGVGRSEEKCYKAIKEIRKENANVAIRYFIADLSLQSEIRKLCTEVTDYIDENYEGRLDVLVNNAGAFTTYYTLTNEGFEMQFAVNHLAPFLITDLMMSALKKSKHPKVLTTSSNSHYGAKIDFDNLMLSKNYNQLRAYKRTKLMNVLFTYELNKRYKDVNNFTAFAVDPALVNTSMGEKNTNGLAKLVWSIRKHKGVSPEEGASTIVYLASENIKRKDKGYYYKNCEYKCPNKKALNKESANRLWKISSRYCEA